MPALPSNAEARKRIPLATGLLDYFPDACSAVAHLSMVANEQHNPGEPLHWAREKSTDHDDCLMRHFLERGTVDTDGIAHRAKVAWRALAALQLECEAAKFESIECGGCAPPVYVSPRRIYEAALSTALGQDAKLDGDLPPNLAAAVSAPNCDGYAYLPDIGIGDVEPRHPMQAEALRQADEFNLGNEETGV